MLTFIDDIKSMPVPGEAGWTPEGLANGILRAEEELLTARLQDDSTRLSSDTVESLIAFAEWLEAICSSSVIEGLQQDRAAFVAGGIREILYQLRTDWADRDEVLGLSFLLRSSTHPFFGLRLAADKLAIRSQTHVQRLFSVLTAFASADYRGIIQTAPKVLQRMTEVDPMSIRESDLARLAIYRRLASASLSLTHAMLLGNSVDRLKALREFNEWFDDNSRHFPSPLTRMARRWQSAANAVVNRSVQGVLGALHVRSDYIDLLLSSGIVELWPQQVEAIKSGLLSDKSAVIGLPTGSGKTLLAEMVFAKRLVAGGQNWGCYVAPTRALVYQVARDLSARLEGAGITIRTVMAGAEDGAALADELDSLATPSTVTVATQERLDAYYRADPERFQSMNVLVVDEAQQISDGERGVLLEQLISKVRCQVPTCKIVLLSATSSNSEELGSWLDANTYSATSRVNRQQLAVAVQIPAQARVIRQWSFKGESRQRLAIPGALVTAGALALRRPGERIPVCAYGSFEAEAQQRLQHGTWLDMDGGSGSTQHATQLARRLHERDETTLVFCATQASARSQAVELSSNVSVENDASLSKFVEAVSSLIGQDHALVTCLKHGIGYHHASLPPTILRLIELAFRDSVIRTLFATSTLREGVNLPAANVVIAGELRPQNQRSAPMRVSDFVNLAGRAGRPQYDREGVAILVPNKLANAITIANRYVLYGPDELAVRSSMGHLIDFLSGFSDAEIFESIDIPLQSILLSLYSSGNIRQTRGIFQFDISS